MIKATKATKQRLANEDFTPYVRLSTLLESIVRQAENADNWGDYDRAFYTDTSLYYRCYLSEAPLFRGVESRFPDLINTTLTYGLNEIVIPDINKLVKAILAR